MGSSHSDSSSASSSFADFGGAAGSPPWNDRSAGTRDGKPGASMTGGKPGESDVLVATDPVRRCADEDDADGSVVRLNVYDLKSCLVDMNTVLCGFGFGAFHLGVEVYGVEYMYGRLLVSTSSSPSTSFVVSSSGSSSRSARNSSSVSLPASLVRRDQDLFGHVVEEEHGLAWRLMWDEEDVDEKAEEWDLAKEEEDPSTPAILEHPPRCCAHVFRESLVMGKTPCSPKEVKTLMRRLGRDWTIGSYHVLRKNCAHFACVVTRELGVRSVPEYLMGACISVAKTMDFMDPTQVGVGVRGRLFSASRGMKSAKPWEVPRDAPKPRRRNLDIITKPSVEDQEAGPPKKSPRKRRSGLLLSAAEDLGGCISAPCHVDLDGCSFWANGKHTVLNGGTPLAAPGRAASRWKSRDSLSPAPVPPEERLTGKPLLPL